MTPLSEQSRKAKNFDRVRYLEVAAEMAKALGKKRLAAKVRRQARARRAS